MRKILMVFLFIVSIIQLHAQRRFSPTGFASPYSTNWYRVGWIMGDSGAIDAVRDTTLGASFPGVRFLWMHSGKDTSEWVFNGVSYIKNLNTQDTLPGRFLVTPSFLASQGYLKNITGFFTTGTGYTLSGSGTIGSPYSLVITGGGGTDSAVNPGLFLKQSVSGMTKNIYADTSFGTGFSSYYLRRVDTSAYTTPTQLATGLATKQGTITLGTTAQYFRGDLSLATFPTNLSAFTNGPGYITGNQSISFTASGDINGTFTHPTVLTPTLTINTNAVTYSKFQQAAGQGLLGSQSAGNYQLVTLGSGLSMTSGVLSATGGGGSGCSNCNADSLKKLPVDTSLRRNGYVLTFDSTDHKWVLAPNGSGTGITALTGDGTAAGSGSVAFTLATVNSNVGTFGSASSVAQFTTNAKGLTTAASSVPIQIAESQVTSLTSDLAGKQSTLSNTPSGGFPLFNLNASAIRELFAGTNVTIDSTTHPGGYTINSSGGGAVSSVSNSDGTLTISPTTGAVVASLALGHANTWTVAQTFNGGLVLGSNVTFATDNTYSIGTSSVGANAINTRFVSSPGILSLQTAGSNPIVFGPNSATKMQLAVTGQLQLNAYTTSTSFTGTPIAFLATDASGNVIQTIGGGSGITQIFAKGPLLVSGADTVSGDTSATLSSYSHLSTQNMLRFINNLEWVDSINSAIFQNNNLIGAKVLDIRIGGVTIPAIPTGNTYYTFNTSTGTISLQNDSFYVGDHTYVIYRAPFIDSFASPTIGQISFLGSFSSIGFFHNNSAANAFSISGTQIVKRNLGSNPMWFDGGDCIDYPLVNTCDPQGYFQMTYRIGSQGNGFGSGIKFGPGQNDGGSGSFISIFSTLNISTLSAAKIYTWNQQVAIDSSTTIAVSVGDSIKMLMTRNKGQFITKVTDLNTGVSVSDTAQFNFTYPGNFILPAAGRWGIAGFGTGIDTIRTLTIGSNSISNPKVIFGGDSKTAAYYPTAENLLFGEQVGASSGLYQSYSIYADPGDRTLDYLANVPYIIQYVKPRYVILNIGRNDLSSFGLPFCSACQLNYNNIVSRFEGAGIHVIHLLPIPETALVQTSLNTFITTTYGTANVIDPSIGFVTGTMLAGDGVHPNASGHTQVATDIINAHKIIY